MTARRAIDVPDLAAPDRRGLLEGDITTMIAVERVPSVSGRERWLVAAAIVAVIAVGSFMFGRQASATEPTVPPLASAIPAVAPASPVAVAPTEPVADSPPPLVRAAAVSPVLELAAARAIAYGEWAVCPAAPPITCDSTAHLVLTPAEAGDARRAWPSVSPVTVPAGHVILAAAQPGIAYALLFSFEPGSTPTQLDPIVARAGIAYFDLGSSLAPGRYIVTIATEPNASGLDQFEAAGIVVGP